MVRRRNNNVIPFDDPICISKLNQQAEFFKQRFTPLKARAEQYIQELLNTENQGKIASLRKIITFYINPMQCKKRRNYYGKNMFAPQYWKFTYQSTSTDFFKLEDEIQTFSIENDLTYNLNLKIPSSSVLNVLIMLSSLPFIQSIQSVTLSYDGHIQKLINQDSELHQVFAEAIKLSIRMILQRWHLESFYFKGQGEIYAEPIAAGIIETVNIKNSLCLNSLNLESVFCYLNSNTTQSLLQALTRFKNLKNIFLGEVNLATEDSIVALNKVLENVKVASLNIGDITQGEKIKLIRFGKKKYDQLNLTFRCDELRHPEQYDKLFSRLAEIISVKYLFLVNEFNLDYLEMTRATKKYSNIHEIKDVLPGSQIVEKLCQVQKIIGQNGELRQQMEYKDIESFKFFERLTQMNMETFNISSMISRKMCDSFMNFLKKGRCKNIDFFQQQPSLSNPLRVPLQIKRIYEQEADIDLNGLYDIIREQRFKGFSSITKIGTIYYTNKSYLDLNILNNTRSLSDKMPNKFDPFLFQMNTLKQISLTYQNISDLQLFALFFEQLALCTQLEFIDMNLSMNAILRRQIQYQKLHNKDEQEQPPSQIYFSKLLVLKKLKNMIINIDVDQIIIDSMTDLLSKSKSIKTFIFRRKLLPQYTINFSQMIEVINHSPILTHVLLDCQLETNPIAMNAHKKIYQHYVFKQFYKPIAGVFENPNCNLNTLEIEESKAQKKGIEAVLLSLTQKKNKTILNMPPNAFDNPLVNKNQDSLYHKALSSYFLRWPKNSMDRYKFISESRGSLCEMF